MRRWLILLLVASLWASSLAGQQVVRRPIVSSAPTFPVNGVLDDFNRGDEGPPPSANWTDSIITTHNGMVVVTNNAFGNSAATNSSWWNPGTFGPDCEAYVTNVDNADHGGVLIRLASPGTAGVDGYFGQWYVTGQQLFIKRIDNGAETVLLTVNSFLPASGDSIGLTAIGSSIELWYKVGAGAWTSKGSVTDGTYSAAGNIGMTVNGLFKLDNFGGGTR